MKPAIVAVRLVALLFVGVLPASGFAAAPEDDDAKLREVARELCQVEAGIAKLVMELRQAGHPMRELLAGNTDASFEKLAIEAYGLPAWPTAAWQQQAITEFESNAFRRCLLERKRVGSLP